MSIRNELNRIHGEHGAHKDVLEEILLRHRPTHAFIRTLVTLASDNEERIQTTATWLLKRLAEDRVRFKAELLIDLFNSLSELTHWLSKLHVCQMLQYVDIPKESTGKVVWFFERNLWDENKFLRAWSYNGFYELAKQHENYLALAIDQLERGETDSAASVRARIRNIRKAMNKLPKRQ